MSIYGVAPAYGGQASATASTNDPSGPLLIGLIGLTACTALAGAGLLLCADTSHKRPATPAPLGSDAVVRGSSPSTYNAETGDPPPPPPRSSGIPQPAGRTGGENHGPSVAPSVMGDHADAESDRGSVSSGRSVSGELR